MFRLPLLYCMCFIEEWFWISTTVLIWNSSFYVRISNMIYFIWYWTNIYDAKGHQGCAKFRIKRLLPFQFRFTFTFTFMHLADAFIQSDLHCIQVTVSTFDQLLLSLGIEPMILALLMPCSYQLSYRKALKETDHPTHEVKVEFQLKCQELEFTKWKFNIMAFWEIKCFFSPSK